MTKVAVKGLLGRKLRAVMTALAVVIGVAIWYATAAAAPLVNQLDHRMQRWRLPRGR